MSLLGHVSKIVSILLSKLAIVPILTRRCATVTTHFLTECTCYRIDLARPYLPCEPASSNVWVIMGGGHITDSLLLGCVRDFNCMVNSGNTVLVLSGRGRVLINAHLLLFLLLSTTPYQMPPVPATVMLPFSGVANVSNSASYCGLSTPNDHSQSQLTLEANYDGSDNFYLSFLFEEVRTAVARYTDPWAD